MQGMQVAAEPLSAPPYATECTMTLSGTSSLTHCCLVNFIDVTLAREDVNFKLVGVETVADDDIVGNNLLQIWKLRFGQKANLLLRL